MLADSTSRILYPSASLSARSLCPPLVLTFPPGLYRVILASATNSFRSFLVLLFGPTSGFPVFETEIAAPLQRISQRLSHKEIAASFTLSHSSGATFGFRNRNHPVSSTGFNVFIVLGWPTQQR